jgi:hypothetical protein
VSAETFLAAARSFAVTPRIGLGMSGYLDRTSAARGRRDDLEVNLLWVCTTADDGVLWVSIDALAVTAAMRTAIVEALARASGIHESRVIVVASHTHSGPGAWHERIHPVFPDQFESADLDALAGAVERNSRALRDQAKPAVLVWRSGDLAGVGGNRHRVDGPHDSSLGLLEVQDAAARRPIALVYDYACHPTVLGPENLRWSADWVGTARERVRDTLPRGDAPLPVVFLQGCAGDASTRFSRLERSDAELVRLGGMVGDRIVDLLARPAVPLPPGPVVVDRTSLRLPVRTDVAPPAREPGTSSERVGSAIDEGARCLAALAAAHPPPVLELPLSVVTLGGRRWMHLPVEMCASYGHDIAGGHDDVRVIGYSDDYLGYVADRQTFREGHYEALASFFDEDTSYRAMTQCRDYLGSVYEASRS